MSSILSIWVDGVAETKGSWISLGRGKLKRDNPREKAWADAVGWAARIKLRGRPPTLERVAVTLRFRLPPRPDKTKKNQRDIDKLARSILDALSKIAYKDDEQVDTLIVRKRPHPDRHGVQIDVALDLGDDE